MVRRKLKLWRVACSFALTVILFLPQNSWATTSNITDSNISNAVNSALINDQAVFEAWINIETNDGIVILKGQVDNLLAKKRAADLAKTVKGVRGVVNNITLFPSTRADAQIKTNLENAYLWDPAAESYEIDVSVNGGVVTLSGTVDSWQEKNLAERIAKGITGVQKVNNNLYITFISERTDADIKNDIEGKLSWNRYIDDTLINVSVENDEVALSGTVGSLAERDYAIMSGWVNGVQSVDGSALKVAYRAHDDRFRREKYVTRSDDDIIKAVKDALYYDPRVAFFNVNVSSRDGFVTLEGTVNNLKAKRSAAQTARNVIGVWSIKNKIKVRPSVLKDQTLKTRLKNALLFDPYTESYEIHVTSQNGKITLYGVVDSYFEKAKADDIASRIKGVIEVNNNLVVSDDYDMLVYDPYVDDDWYLYDYTWYVLPTYSSVVPDKEIKQNINGELFWSPFVDSDDVNVKVDNGIAILTGTVNTWGEYWAAQENAYEGGATLVRNRLEIDYGPGHM